MKTSPRGLDLIKQFEGFSGKAYLCPAGVPTIGFGTTIGVSAEDVAKGRTVTRAQADKLLKKCLAEFEQAVTEALTVPPNQNQFDACVCMAYNIGAAGFRSSSVVKAHNKGDFQSAARAFGLWNKATVNGKKQELAGLTRRRAAEAALYLEPDGEEEPMPQAVEPEKPLAESAIVRGATIAGSTASLATVADLVNTTNSIKDGVTGLGPWLVPILLIAVIGFCGYVIYERVVQRKRGWV